MSDGAISTLFNSYEADIRCSSFSIRWNICWLLEQIEEYCQNSELRIQTRDDENEWVNDDENEGYGAFYDVEREQRWLRLMAGHLGSCLERALGDILWRELDECGHVLVGNSIHEFCNMPKYREHIRIVGIAEESDDEE